jgi:TolB-like protein
MTDLWQRLKQRKLVQWAIAYVAFAFAVIQVLDVVAQRFGWPDQIEKLLILALAIGFVIVLVLAWYHGERGAQKVSSTEIVILALLLAIGGGLLWRYERVLPSAGSPAAARRNPGAVTATPAIPIPAKSIAVLPFVNMSGDPKNEYFSDGMSEEILNALAQVNDLRVAGRTSSFYYKGRNEDLRTIGKALGVAVILEGSVRKQGNEVRITAQLIRVTDDTHLWSHAYDGDLSDVFKLQENIARAITEQLNVVLSGSQQARLVNAGTTNPAAYNLYLHATDAFNRRDYALMGEAVGWLQQAIAFDPHFARAHSLLAMIHVLGQRRYGASLSEVEPNARAALALDPRDVEAQVALGLLARHQRR